MSVYKLNQKYKDRMFRFVFHDRKKLLELYNAMNDSSYTNEDELEITTIDDVVYMGMKNDLSFIIGDVLNLYEHQSSFSPNLPLRGLFYFASLYRSYAEPMKHRLYSETPLCLPSPRYVVFYNGRDEEPERQELRLSELFLKKDDKNEPSLECTALMLNINHGCNQKLMEKCRPLREYALFVAAVREHAACGMDVQEAVEAAVEECIRKGILSEILRKNRTEVVEMILTEYNEEEYRDFLKEEYRQKGLEEGLEEGRKKGLQEGLKEGKREGFLEGLEQGKKDLYLTKKVFKLRMNGESKETIAKECEISVEEVEAILE